MGARELVFTAELHVRYKPLDPESLERTVAAEGRKAARELYRRVRGIRSANSSTLRRSATSALPSAPEGASHGCHSTRSATSPGDAFVAEAAPDQQEFGAHTSTRKAARRNVAALR